MAKYNVEWSISARGVVRVDAQSLDEAEAIVGDMEPNRLIDRADRIDWETYPTFVN